MLNDRTIGYLQWLAARPWLMRKADLWQMAATIIRGDRLTEAQVEAASAARDLRLFGAVAVIPILGPIVHRGGWMAEYFGLTSCQRIRESVRQALANDEVKAILFETDSPGGEVDGTPEVAAELFALRGQKPMLAIVNTMQCSAAHWIGAQADEVIISPSGQVGSIGCWTLHADESAAWEEFGIKWTLIFAGERKVDGNPFEALSDDAKADLQTSVNDVHREFLAAVARARGTTPAAVRDGYGEGRVYGAKQALKLGVVDRIATIDQVLAKLNGVKSNARRAEEPGWWKTALAEIPTEPIHVLEVKAGDEEDPVAPDADGHCPDGYDKGDDGQCYLTKKSQSTADVDQAAIDRDSLELSIAEADAL